MKKSILIFSLFSLLFSLWITRGYSSDDISNAQYLANNAIVKNQKSPELYRLDDVILRQEVIGMALRIQGITLPENYTCKKYFADVISNDWVCRAVELAADNGIISRANTRARPMDKVTRAEALAILLKTGKVSLSAPRRVTQTDGSVWSLFQDLKTLGFTQWQADMLDSLPGCSLINHGDSCEDGASTNQVFSRFQPNVAALRSSVFEFAALMMWFQAGDYMVGILDDLDILVPQISIPTQTLVIPQDTNHLSTTTIKSLLQDEPIQTVSVSPTIVLVVFSDLECPFCARLSQDTIAPIINDASTQTALIYKHFPLPFHNSAYRWAVESECVVNNLWSKAYFDYIDARYADQNVSVYDLFPDLTIDQLDICRIDDNIVAQRIKDEQALGVRYKVNGTPTTLVINTKTGYYETIVGAQAKEFVEDTIQSVKAHL